MQTVTSPDRSRDAKSATGGKQQVAIVAYPGCSLLELVGAQTVWAAAAIMSSLQPVVVGPTTDSIPSSTPLSFSPQKTFQEVPDPDVLLVVGDDRAAAVGEDSDLLDYVRSAAQQASIVASTGTGSLILAGAGLLQGRKATTHRAFRDRLEATGVAYQQASWVEDERYFTGAGSSSALDLSLLLIARLRSERLARRAQIIVEWDPAPPFGPLDWSRNEIGAEHTEDGEAQGPSRRIALLIYPGLTVLDLVGPLEVLTTFSRLQPEYEPVVVAEELVPVVSDSGLTFYPNQSFDDVPAPDLLIVPGGGLPTLRAMSHQPIRDYVRRAASSSAYTVSVCTGALLLASVGLLEGRDATTHWAYRSYLGSFGASYVQRRWVSSQGVINSAGVSAGIDMALYLVSQLTDERTARQVQQALHYDPHPPFGGIDYDRLPGLMRAMRTVMTLTSPFYTRRPRRLLRAGI